MPAIAVDPIIRFRAKTEITDTCHLWQGCTTNGYGRFRVQGVSHRAHRWIWIHERGPIPPELEIDHLCRVRHCVNVDHMELVTHQENITRAFSLITHCKDGHLIDGFNKSKGRRYCLTCSRMNTARWRARKVAA